MQVIPLHLPPGDPATERTLYIDGTTEQIEIAKQLVSEVTSEVGFLFLVMLLTSRHSNLLFIWLLKSCWFDSHILCYHVFVSFYHFPTWPTFLLVCFKDLSFYAAMIPCVRVDYTLCSRQLYPQYMS